MLKQDLMLQIMNQTDHYPEYKTKTVTGFMQDESGEKNNASVCCFETKNIQLFKR